MAERRITTAKGTILLKDAPYDLVVDVASRWPMGLCGSLPIQDDPSAATVTGIVFQRGDTELKGVKLQPPDYTDQADALKLFQINSWVNAAAIAGYLRAGFTGVLLVGAYLRNKTKSYEPGVALFPAPDAHGPENAQGTPLTHVDSELGPGSSAMVVAMGKAIQGVWQAKLGQDIRWVGIDVRARLQLGMLRMDLLVCGQHILYVRTKVAENDPFWEWMAGSGVRELYHLPSVPLQTPS